MNLPRLASDDLHAIDAWERFEIVFEIFRNIRQPHEAHFARHACDENRDLRKVHVLDAWIVHLRRQIGFGEVDFLAHFLNCGVEIHLGIELDLNRRKAFGARGTDFFDARDPFELRLDGARDEGLHVCGRHPRIDRVHDDERDLDFGKGFPRHRNVCARADDDDEADEHIDRQAMTNAVFR